MLASKPQNKVINYSKKAVSRQSRKKILKEKSIDKAYF